MDVCLVMFEKKIHFLDVYGTDGLDFKHSGSW